MRATRYEKMAACTVMEHARSVLHLRAALETFLETANRTANSKQRQHVLTDNSGGGYLPGPGGCTCLVQGVYLVRVMGVPAWSGGVPAWSVGVYLPGPGGGGTSCLVRYSPHPPVNRMNDRLV